MDVYKETIIILEQVYNDYMDNHSKYAKRGLSEDYYILQAIKIKFIIDVFREKIQKKKKNK